MLMQVIEKPDSSGTIHFTQDNDSTKEITFSIEEQQRARRAKISRENIISAVEDYISSGQFITSCMIKISSNAEVLFVSLNSE